MHLSTTPVLNRVPRIRKFSAGRSPRSFVPQASLEPLPVRLEATGGEHAGARLDALATDPGRDEAAPGELDRIDRRVVPHANAEPCSAPVVGVDQGLAAAHEERVGSGEMKSAGQRRLEVHTMTAHPVAAGGRLPDRDSRERLVRQAARDLEQILPVLLFGIGIDEHVLRRIVHAADVAGMRRIATAPGPGRALRQHRGPRLAGHQRCAKSGVSSADHENIEHAWRLEAGAAARTTAPGR
jgi:hypothetical protein